MNKRTKIWLISATSLIIIGLAILISVMTVCNWDFTILNNVSYETNTYQFTDSFEDISINTKTADISFLLTNDKKCKVVCLEEANMKHSVYVKDGALSMTAKSTKKWYEYIGINFSNAKLTVYLPKHKYKSLFIKEITGDIEIPADLNFKNIDISTDTGSVTNLANVSEDIKIKTSTGKINIKNSSANTVDLSVSTGKITVDKLNCKKDLKIKVSTGSTNLSNINCKNFISSGDTGKISLKDVIATEKFSIIRSTGNINFLGCDASEIFVKTDTGNVSGTLLTDKVFITESDTGSINVPKTIIGGKCEITTDTGNIKIKISK